MNDYLLGITYGRAARRDTHPILAGDREPEWLHREAEHRRLLEQMRREEKAASLLAPQPRIGLGARLRQAFGRA